MVRGLSTLFVALAACSTPREHPSAAPAPPPSASSAAPPPPPIAPRADGQLDGRGFPDHVLALTWDDGPDVNTVRLAKTLASQRVSATFFVVDAWEAGVSEEPGQGEHVFETGTAHLPVLSELVAQGHRLGNHTAHHVLLAGAKASVVRSELALNQRALDPFLRNEQRTFRAPGGAWDEAAARAIESESALQGMLGPVRWDIDRKDWESSLYCHSDHPEVECESAAPGQKSRVRPEVTAARYLETIASTGHGIVLFHDRVGHVGSDYALKVAAHVVPELLSRGYVFGPVVLAFSPFRARARDRATSDWIASLDAASLTFADVDRDGRADLCGIGRGADRRFGCARSIEEKGTGDDTRPVTKFAWTAAWNESVHPSRVVRPAATRLLGDLNGDGRDDTCTVTPAGLSCALTGPHGPLGSSVWLANDSENAIAWLSGTLLLADVNADGRADLCSVRGGDVSCALAP